MNTFRGTPAEFVILVDELLSTICAHQIAGAVNNQKERRKIALKMKNTVSHFMRKKHKDTLFLNGHYSVILQPILKNYRCFEIRKASSF